MPKWLVLWLMAAAGTANLDERLAKWKPVQMPFQAKGLSARERQMVDKLVEAAQQLDNIYWRQSDPEGLELYKTTSDPKLKRLLIINGCRWDLLDENLPFVGSEPMPPGHALYPKGLTRADLERYVRQHPEKKQQVYSGYTVVRRQGNDLAGTPYHVEYRQFLEAAAKALRDAAALSADPAFARFLRLRADALLSDDYFESDLAWLDLKEPRFDVIMAPYETYLDDLMGIKTSYGSAVLVRNEAESAKLTLYQNYVPDIQDALPLAAPDRPSKRGHLTPMEVMDAPYRGGDLRHGYQAVADNLPNDPRIHEKKGTKKIFFKNFMDARVNYVILPLAKRLMRADQAARASGEGYMAGTLMHEISHGLGPAFARVGGKQVDIREALGPVYSGLEEAKADVVGMYGMAWLFDRGAMPRDREREYYDSYLAGIFRTIRFGTGEAHGRAEMMEFNYLFEQGGIQRENGKYVVDYARIRTGLGNLAKELLVIEATGDRKRAEAWMKKYDVIPPDLQAALKGATDIPVDVDPTFSFPDQVR